jgi:hypothetical protein
MRGASRRIHTRKLLTRGGTIDDVTQFIHAQTIHTNVVFYCTSNLFFTCSLPAEDQAHQSKSSNRPFRIAQQFHLPSSPLTSHQIAKWQLLIKGSREWREHEGLSREAEGIEPFLRCCRRSNCFVLFTIDELLWIAAHALLLPRK